MKRGEFVAPTYLMLANVLEIIYLKPIIKPNLAEELNMIESQTLTVTGMKCGGCETNVTEKLKVIPGVISVSASAKNNEVSIEYNNELTDIATLKTAILNAGFEV